MLKEEEEERVTNTTWRRKGRKGNGNFAGAREQGKRKKKKGHSNAMGNNEIVDGLQHNRGCCDLGCHSRTQAVLGVKTY